MGWGDRVTSPLALTILKDIEWIQGRGYHHILVFVRSMHSATQAHFFPHNLALWGQDCMRFFKALQCHYLKAKLNSSKELKVLYGNFNTKH